MKLLLKEHQSVQIKKQQDQGNCSLVWASEIFDAIPQKPLRSFRRERGVDVFPFSFDKIDEFNYGFKADYYIGIDWLIKGKKYVQVEPKINQVIGSVFVQQLNRDEEEDRVAIALEETEVEQKLASGTAVQEIDYLKILLTLYSGLIEWQYLDNLVQIHWEDEKIKVEQHQDHLTPFLVVQFLQILKSIVRKGLKSSYYKIQQNLEGRVKGKILIGQQLKQNIVKNKLTATMCEYQIYGVDSVENRFLKKVFRFVCSYVENSKGFFKENHIEINEAINFCRPAFESIGDQIEIHQLKQFKVNAFFKEYKEAVKIGQMILKRFAYNISQTTDELIETPPFWIDMPRLFELYVYHQLLRDNPLNRSAIHYQFSTYGNALDVLVSHPEHQMVIDAKYKIHYMHGQIHSDIRQVAGYARLEKVRKKLKVSDDTNIDCVIFYPDTENGVENFSLENIKTELKKDSNKIKVYHKVFKLGVKLPWVK